MRLLLLATLLLLLSCDNKKNDLVKRQQTIIQEMEQIKAAYYKLTDSLDKVKSGDTSSTKQLKIMKEIVAADSKKNGLLITLQKEYDSLSTLLKH